MTSHVWAWNAVPQHVIDMTLCPGSLELEADDDNAGAIPAISSVAGLAWVARVCVGCQELLTCRSHICSM